MHQDSHCTLAQDKDSGHFSGLLRSHDQLNTIKVTFNESQFSPWSYLQCLGAANEGHPRPDLNGEILQSHKTTRLTHI